jgi:hypothetical protein
MGNRALRAGASLCKTPEAGRRMASFGNRKACAAVLSRVLAKTQDEDRRGLRGRRASGATLELYPEGTREPRKGPE